jgi:hypothetical protein
MAQELSRDQRRKPRARPITPTKLSLCPRCGGRMVRGYEEPLCPACGFSDYQNPAKATTRTGRQNFLSSGTRYIVRYIGSYIQMKRKVIFVRSVHRELTHSFSVRCPFCEESMVENSESCHLPRNREMRYFCSFGHRVSLVLDKTGLIGWC